MDDQKYLQARNCITNYCFYPRTAATQLVERMTQGEVEQILRVADPVEKPADEKKVGIDKILADCQQRWEKEASQRASRVMEQQKTLHAAEQVPAGEPIEELDPADHLMTFILSEEVLEELGELIIDVSSDTLDRVERFAVQLKECCDQVRSQRQLVNEEDDPPQSPVETPPPSTEVPQDASPPAPDPPQATSPEEPGASESTPAPEPTPAPQDVPGPANPPRPDKPNEVA